MANKYDLIYFDADETLFDFSRTQYEAFEATRTHFGIENSEVYFELYQKHNHDLWGEFEKNLVTQNVLRVERFKRFFEDLLSRGWIDNQFMPERFEDVATFFEIELGKGAYLLEGAKMLCETLAESCDIAIITNGLKNVQHARFGNSEIVHLIKHVIVSEETGYQKPQIEIFQFAERLTGFTDKTRILMVGDSLVSDIAGGIAYGIDTCWYNPKRIENKSDYQPTFEIQTLEELMAYL